MANITSLTELTEVADDDLLVAVDKSDTTMADSGTDKKVKKSSLAKSLLDFFYPVGTIYETTSGNLDTVDKMNTHFGGTWEVYGAGRVLVAKSTDTEFNTLGKTGGGKTVTLSRNNLPVETVVIAATSPGAYGSGDFSGFPMTTTSTPVPINNLQPYIVVYRYRRTA